MMAFSVEIQHQISYSTAE